MKKGDIVSVVTFSGEYVGEFESYDEKLVLNNPKMIVRNPQTGEMGFSKGIAATGEESPTEVVFENIIFVTPSNERVKTAHKSAVTGIEVPSKPKIVT